MQMYGTAPGRRGSMPARAMDAEPRGLVRGAMMTPRKNTPTTPPVKGKRRG